MIQNQRPIHDDEVHIRQFGEEDWTAVSHLYSEVFGSDAEVRFRLRWNWQYQDFPWKGLGEAKNIVAVFGDEILGHIAWFPIRFRVFDTVEIVQIPCDLMVSPKARGRGVAKKLINAFLPEFHPLATVQGFSPVTAHLFRQLSYGEVPALSVMVRPYDFRAVARYLISKKLPQRDNLAVLLSLPFRLLNLSSGLVNRFFKRRAAGHLRVERITEADSRFDTLWGRIGNKFPISAVRDRLWVQWRFLEDPVFEHHLLGAFESDGELTGYIDVRVGRVGTLKVGRILDLFCNPSATPVAHSLIASGLEVLEQMNVDVVTCTGHLPGIRQHLSKWLFSVPDSRCRPVLVRWTGDRELESSIYARENWHLTLADSDEGSNP